MLSTIMCHCADGLKKCRISSSRKNKNAVFLPADGIVFVILHLMTYVDVILPLPIDGLFTYSVPTGLERGVAPFFRVKVPFGLTKTHTALVAGVHQNAPTGDIVVKPIISVLDKRPVLLAEQY